MNVFHARNFNSVKNKFMILLTLDYVTEMESNGVAL